MKKVLWCVLFIILLCGCSDEENTIAIDESVQSDTDTLPSIKEGLAAYMNIHSVKTDATTGAVKYGTFLDKQIVYEGEELELGVSVEFDIPNEECESVTALLMLVVNNELTPFSLDNSEKEMLQEVVLDNGKDKTMLLSFKPDNLGTNQTSDWIIAAIPLLDEYAHPAEETVVISCHKQIISCADNSQAVSNQPCENGYFFDSTVNVYGKKLNEISKYNGTIQDYILQDNKGDWYYMGDNTEGKYLTMLFCDNQYFNGFDGTYNLMVNKTSAEPVHKKVDMSSIENGNYNFYTVTFYFKENGKYSGCFKSLNTEVFISAN